MGQVRAVLFDVGETLLDETRQWEGWARWLGVPAPWFFAALGATIEAGNDHREVFDLFGRPGLDIAAARQERKADGDHDDLGAGDLYRDALPCLAALAEAGITVGIAANQPAEREPTLRALFPGLDVVLLSGAIGVAKPDPTFFTTALERLGSHPAETAYVGDRLDNDVLPALRAGMVAVHLRRGPWGVLHAAHPDAGRASIRIDGLEQLLPALERLETPSDRHRHHS